MLFTILGSEAIALLYYFQTSADKEGAKNLLIALPMLISWFFATKYCLYNFWYIIHVRKTGKAHVYQSYAPVPFTRVDLTSPYNSELKGYDVTYETVTFTHNVKRLIMILYILVTSIMALIVSFMILNGLGWTHF